MPVYLVHGFRWPRAGFTGIRVHIIIHNLDDCSAEYIQNPLSQAELLKSFRTAYPEIMKDLDPRTLGDGKGIQFVEQYDPDDEHGDSAASQPFAFIGDKVVMIAGGHPAMPLDESSESTVTSSASGANSETAMQGSAKRASKGSVTAGIAAAAAMKTQALSLNVEDVIAGGPGVTATAWEAFADLRDKIAPGEKIGWWVVFNGDPERAYESDYDDEEEEEEEEEEEDEDENYEEVVGTSMVTGEDQGEPHSPKTRQSEPTFPIAERARPPQPPPKPRMFEQPDQNRSNAQPSLVPPLRSPPKSSGKRLPGMKVLSQLPAQQQQVPEASKSGSSLKSESSLKKKLFGGRRN